MIEVPATEANNYSRILTLLGMEEEGDPVKGVVDCMKWRQTAELLVKENMGLRTQLAERDSELVKWRDLHEAIAKLRDTDVRWPSHGNAPLAIAAGYALLQKDRNDLHERVTELQSTILRLMSERDKHRLDLIDAGNEINAFIDTTRRLNGKVAEFTQKNKDLDRSETQLIGERDEREEIINEMCDAILGKDRHEWSSMYGFADAVQDVEVKTAVLDKEVSELYALRARVAELEKLAEVNSSIEKHLRAKLDGV